MPIKVKVSLSKDGVTAADKFLKAKLKLVERNIAAVIKDEAIPHLIDLIMFRYDEMGKRMDKMSDEDPTNPQIWRGVFKDKLEEEAQQTFIFDGNSGIIKLNLGEKSFLGYTEEPDTDSTTPLQWMVYYLEGLSTSYAWITRESWEQVFPDGKWDPEWGRFKSAPGFMLRGREFHKSTNPWAEELTWSEKRHPFSSSSPQDIFAEALNEFKIRPFIQKAIDAATAGKKL